MASSSNHVQESLKARALARDKASQWRWTAASVVLCLVAYIWPVIPAIRYIVVTFTAIAFVGVAYYQFHTLKLESNLTGVGNHSAGDKPKDSKGKEVSNTVSRVEEDGDKLVGAAAVPDSFSVTDLASQVKLNSPLSFSTTQTNKAAKSYSTSTFSSLTPMYKNFEYSTANAAAETILESVTQQQQQQQQQQNHHNQHHPSPFSLNRPSGASFRTPQQQQQHQKQRTPTSSSLTFLKYHPSPVSERNSPVPTLDQIASKHNRPSIVKSTDALTYLRLQLNVAVVDDDWLENFKCVLGRHLYETIKRFDELALIIVRELKQRGVSIEILQIAEKVLLLQSERESMSVFGEVLDLEIILTQCRSMQIRQVDDYLHCYSIFFLRGQAPKIGNASLATVQRMRELFMVLRSSPDKYLHIEYDSSSNYRNRFTSSNAYGFFSNRPNQATSSSSSTSLTGGGGTPHDSDIVMGLFLHMCDANSELSSRLYNHKFSAEHYADNMTLLPEPQRHHGDNTNNSANNSKIGIGNSSSKGINSNSNSNNNNNSNIVRNAHTVGIVRTSSDSRGASSPLVMKSNSSGGNNNGSSSVSSGGGSGLLSSSDSMSRPHFNVYIVHDKPGTPSVDNIENIDNNYLNNNNNNPGHGSSSSSSLSSSWRAGDVGIEILTIIDGRQNCFESILLLLVLMIKRQDPAIRDFGVGSTLQRLALDVFRARDWRELEEMLNV